MDEHQMTLVSIIEFMSALFKSHKLWSDLQEGRVVSWD